MDFVLIFPLFSTNYEVEYILGNVPIHVGTFRCEGFLAKFVVVAYGMNARYDACISLHHIWGENGGKYIC